MLLRKQTPSMDQCSGHTAKETPVSKRNTEGEADTEQAPKDLTGCVEEIRLDHKAMRHHRKVFFLT